MAQQLTTFILQGAKKAPHYIRHFMNELKGSTQSRCMFCFQFFGSHSAKNNHIARVHRNARDALQQYVPESGMGDCNQGEIDT